MKILNRVLTVAFLGLISIVAVLAVIGLFLPKTARVDRSITIDASPGTVFTVLNGFGRAHEWSPWHPIDPDVDYSLVGPERGVGARLDWVRRHPRAGSGSERITESKPDTRVTTILEFGGGSAESRFVLEPAAEGTRLLWTMTTDLGNNVVARYFGFAFERTLGPDLAKGLADLKTLAEGEADAAADHREPRP